MRALPPRAAAIAIAALLIAACGGNDDDTPDMGSSPSPSPPPLATVGQPTETIRPEPEAPPATPPDSGPRERSEPAPTEVPDSSTEPPPGVVALFPGHNDLDTDRINLVVAASGWGDFDRFVAFAKEILTFDGEPLLLDENGEPTAAAATASQAAFGLFAIEPWRSSRQLFNVWYLTEQADDPTPTLNRGQNVSGLPNELVVYLVPDFEFESVAGQTSFFPPDLPDRDGGFFFGDVLIDVPTTAPFSVASNLAHEVGHAMFGLSDEYVGDFLGFDGRSDLTSYPACAEDRDEAETFWGAIAGDVDPMFEIWMETLRELGLGFRPADVEFFRSRVTVGYVDGGCYGVDGSYRATQDSLMYGEIPVLGSANRQWAERVLALWSSS